MSNHVHLIVVPHTAGAMSQTLKHTHGRYASYWNARQPSTGHVAGTVLFLSAGRFASLGRAALCGVESGAGGHGVSGAGVAMVERRGTLQPRGFGHNAGNGGLGKAVDSDRVEEYLAAGESPSEVSALRRCTHTGRPLGTSEFVAALEQTTLRYLAPRKGGRPKKSAANSRQDRLPFVA